MDNLSSELNKLRIDKSKRGELRASKGRGKYLALVLILLLLGAAASLGYRAATAPVVVDTVRPKVESAEDAAVLIATGYVIAHHKIQVGSKVMGRVAWIGVEKGDHVARNQLVVRLEDREYRAQYEQAQAAYQSEQAKLSELQRGSRPEEVERARHDVERAEAQLRADEAQLRRIESLVKQGVAPPQTLDDAQGKYDTSKAGLASLTKTLELVRQGPRQEQIDGARSEVGRAKAAMEYAKSILDATEIRAPIEGTILERNVEQGEMVTTSFVGDRGAKSFVVTVADLKDLQIELDINQNDFNRINSSQPCKAVTDAFPDRVYKCQVDEIAPEANRQKATVQVKVKFLEPDEYVKPEMNANVTFLPQDGGAKKNGSLIIVPKRAILDRENAKVVMVIADGKAQEKPITIQNEVGLEVYVSSGLSGKESLIVGDKLAQLKSGDKVTAHQ